MRWKSKELTGDDVKPGWGVVDGTALDPKLVKETQQDMFGSGGEGRSGAW